MGQCLSNLKPPSGRLPSVRDLNNARDSQEGGDRGDGGEDKNGVSPRDVKLQTKKKKKSTASVSDATVAKTDGLIVRALYDFAAVNEDDMSFKKGDKMRIEESTTELDWWQATHLKSHKVGYIPNNYVQVDDNSIQAQDWWFGSDRKEADLMLLLPGNSNGTFLVREAHDHKSQVLSVRYENAETGDPTVKHYRINRLDNGGYYVSPKNLFSNLFELVEFYSKTSQSGLCVKLSQPCPRLRPCEIHFKDLEVDRADIRREAKLGAGHFGEVWKGKFKNATDVAIKTLKPGTMSRDEFMREAEIMHQMRHNKLVNLLAVCSKDEPIWIITEFMANGSLLDYLRKSDARKLVKFPTLIKMAAQIADGMFYLEIQNFIHRDLRAANILVGEQYEVKVADFGLARTLEDDDVYDACVKSKFPIKWTAPEAGLRRKFSVKSDVWSFGVLLYELLTYGRIPYPDVRGEILLKLDSGYRMPNPSNSQGVVCPPAVYDMMLKCWSASAADRPTFEFLKCFFEDYEVTSETQYC